MSATQILSANALTQKKWPETMFKYTLANMQLSKFMGGPESGMPIIIDQNLAKGTPGDQIVFKLRMPLTGAGGSDDSTIEGSEEAMAWHNMSLYVHERNNGVVSAGKMTDKRAAVNAVKEGFIALGDWAAEQQENDLHYALCGLGNQGGYVGEGATSIATVNEHAPSSNRILYGGQTIAGVASWVANDAAINAPTSYLFGSRVIAKMKYRALSATPKIQPVKINGKGYYVLLIHPLQANAWREETSATGFITVQAQANVRGDKNPIFGKDGEGMDRMFDGAMGIYDDVIVYVDERLPTRIAGEVFHSASDVVDASIVSGTYRIARCVLLGAQAAVLGWGQQWQRYTKDFDYNRKPGVATDAIYGASKTIFNDPGLNQSTNTPTEDFGVIVCDTAVQEG